MTSGQKQLAIAAMYAILGTFVISILQMLILATQIGRDYTVAWTGLIVATVIFALGYIQQQ